MADDRALTEMEDLGQPVDAAVTPAVDSIPGAGSVGAGATNTGLVRQ